MIEIARNNVFWSLPQKVVESLELTGTSVAPPHSSHATADASPGTLPTRGFFRGTLSNILDHLTDAADLLRSRPTWDGCEKSSDLEIASTEFGMGTALGCYT